MSNFFNGNTINQAPAPIIPSQQVVIPPITIPNGLTVQPSMPASYNQITVKGKDAAKNYRLGPNSRAALFDEDQEVFYYKETDANGNEVAFKAFTYSEVEEPPEPEYLTVQEFRSALDDFAQKLKEELLDGQSIRTQNQPNKQSYNGGRQQSSNSGNAKS